MQIVVDGMTPAAFEDAVSSGRAPALAFLAANGTYGQAASVFPSLTPVCLSSIVTGAGPDIHEIPSLVWWHRGERRIVEYGSSFAALRAAGVTQSIQDTILNMNERHLSSRAVTVFEALEDAGLVAAAVNITCYRGRSRHAPKVPLVRRPAFGPSRFFYYSLFESDRTGARLAVRNRGGGSVDAYAAEVGRWLVTRDGFDFLVYYLSDYDYASHAFGPAGALEVALERTDAAIEGLFDAAGGRDAFLERYAVVLHSDHGQTGVREVASLPAALAGLDPRLFVAPSNRAGHVYLLPGARVDAAAVARRLDGEAAVETTLRLEDGEAVARRDGEELRFSPDADAWETSGDVSLLDGPDAFHRAWSALANPNAGELLVSAAEGWELADLGGSHHAGGGSHGSLVAGDSLVPMLTVGLDARLERVTDAMPAVLAHFGVEPPPYAAPHRFVPLDRERGVRNVS